MQHVDFIYRELILSKNILQFCINNDIEKLNIGLENRQRLIDIIGEYQNQIESLLFNKKSVDNEYKEILDAWNFDINMVMTKINKIDELITESLSNQKNQISNQIAQNHISKTKFKGYNLNNVK